MDLREVGYDDREWINLAQDKDRWRAYLPDTETLLFRDGKRRIDMVLVYEEEDYGVMTLAEVTRREMRKVFQENLVKEGLELELEEKQMAFDQEKYFVKIHVPWKALTRYAEVMNMKMPIKQLEKFPEYIS
ncbi:hypothetical protein ANN_06408 [Periplaneta americana]|uniref:Anoctamin dimerisation domain-containing protein n=1 Tax=Periplaneta americana TaxID=6978 RepID=A0ABQ8TDG0_PERAM|nr:hypothetical protein ANN_06408 [Periplaneta americana]